MREYVASPPGWAWTALGKHPVARDYFRLGPDFPLAGAFSTWVEKGYRELAVKSASPAEFRSWRFWARGPGSDGLVCGVVRDSCDDIGRPFPFLSLGAGALDGWEENWDLLPLACEMPWGRIEYLSTQKLDGFPRMEVEVSARLRAPVPDWRGLAEKRGAMPTFRSLSAGGSILPRVEEMGRKAARLSGSPGVILSLDGSTPPDPLGAATLWTHLLRKNGAEAPGAVFIGGRLGNAFMAIFRRPLTAGDFLRLWTASPGEDEVLS